MMDVFSWIGWIVWSLLALLWSVVWLLLGGWISTLAQIIVVLMAIFVYRYGWARAPAELIRQTRAVWRFATGAMRASEALAEADADRKRSAARVASNGGNTRRSRPFSPRHVGDVTINLSSALSIGMLGLMLWLSLF